MRNGEEVTRDGPEAEEAAQARVLDLDDATARLAALVRGFKFEGVYGSEGGARFLIDRDTAERLNSLLQDHGDALAEIRRLREALAPFARLGKGNWLLPAFHDLEADVVLFENSGDCITAGDVREAWGALRGLPRAADPPAPAEPEPPPEALATTCRRLEVALKDAETRATTLAADVVRLRETNSRLTERLRRQLQIMARTEISPRVVFESNALLPTNPGDVFVLKDPPCARRCCAIRRRLATWWAGR
jgi:hypothetical protein